MNTQVGGYYGYALYDECGSLNIQSVLQPSFV
jgi:methyl coenzyme M reductase alpha subunit